MVMIFSSFIYLIFFFKSSLKKREVFLVASIVLFYMIFILGWFHIIKFDGELTLMFPDENTYYNNDPNGGIFGQYISLLRNSINIQTQKIINLFCYIFSITYFCRINKYNYSKLNFTMITILVAIGSYWSFFILKESLAIVAQLVILSAFFKKNKIALIIGGALLIVFRFEFFILFIVTYLLLKLYSRNKFLFFVIITLVFLLIYLNFNVEYFNKIKLYSLSKRFGESNKIYDFEALKTLEYNLFSFILSKPYIETLKYNLNNSFNIFYLPGFAKILVMINTIGIVYIIVNIKKLICDKFFYYFIVPFLILILTHSTYRYINSLIIPYMLVFTLKNKQERRKKNEE